MSKPPKRKLRKPLDFALDYLKRGLQPLPVKYQSKKPSIGEGWPNFRCSVESASQYFNGEDQNIGVLLGAPSGDLIDIDLDDEFARVLAPHFLPKTGMIFGRASSPESHYLYIGQLSSKKFTDPTDKPDAMLVEIRSTGMQTVFPGSVHESGERISWHLKHEPSRPPTLARDVATLAAASLIARHWGTGGKRDETAAALAGILSRSWSADKVEHFIGAIARAANDEEHRSRRCKAHAKPGGKRYGWPKLREHLGSQVCDRLREWLELDASDDAPEIVLRTAVEIVSNPVPARWLHKLYLEQDVLAVMYGDYGTYKTFLGLDLSLHLAAGRPYHNDNRKVTAIPCVYISAEGRGLSKRIRAWVRHHFPNEVVEDVLKRLKFYAVEAAVNLSNPNSIKALSDAIDALPEHPALIVVDTLTKNSSGEVEESNSTMTVFLNKLNELRMQFRCTVLLIHHVGHTNKERARGPISLIANTDAALQVERTGPFALRLKVERLKDSEVPQPLLLEAKVIDLGTIDEDGEPETSLVLVRGGIPVKVIPTGTNQRKVYDVLIKQAKKEVLSYTRAELNKLARTVIAAERVPEAIKGLTSSGWLTERSGNWEFAE